MSTVPVFLVDALRLGDDEVVIDGAEGWHGATVRRLTVGELVDVTDGRGRVVSCAVSSVKRDVVVCDVQSVTDIPPSQPHLTVVQALAKGDRGERAVEMMTEVGVDEIVPWAAARSIARWRGERGEKALLKWRSTACEAAKQARRAWVPDVVDQVTKVGALVSRVKAARLALVLHESAAQPLAAIEVPDAGEVLIVIGPEGGITDSELAAMTEAGGVAVRLGPSVLRTSTAGAVAAGVVLSRTSRWHDV